MAPTRPDPTLLEAAAARTENDALIELARTAAFRDRGPVPGAEHLLDVVLPPGHAHELIDLERFQPAPRRKRGQVVLHTASAFIAYAQRHLHGEGIDSPTTIYADADAARFVAVLNDATAGEPGWADHRAVLELRKTEPWEHWTARDGLLGSQGDFARHIEDGLLEIVNPPAADMLELAQTFEAHQGVAFKQAQRLADGQRVLLYEETIEARAGQRGTIEIPNEFELALAPYEGSAVVKVVARLRYRMSGGSLAIGYQLVRPHDVLRAAFIEALDIIDDEVVEAQVFRGTPPIRS
jgi:uncharacterized protein YfdQ (DUF2303 family)